MNKNLIENLIKGNISVVEALNDIKDNTDEIYNDDFLDWVKLELIGFEKIDRALIPDHRWVEADIILVGTNALNEEVHTVLEIPDEYYHQLGYTPVKYSIATIEKELKGGSEEYKIYPLSEFELQGFTISTFGYFNRKGFEVERGYRRTLNNNLGLIIHKVKQKLIKQLQTK